MNSIFNKADNPMSAFSRLLHIMNDLRQNCPWDKKQTIDSLRHLTIEETYELSDAILDNNWDELKKELGDIMLHLVFYAKIGSEQNQFDITDVLNGICEKLIHRHPHIYADVKVNNAEDVKYNWEQIKLKEKGNKGVLAGVPKSMPSIVKAMRMQEKAAQVGFDWEQKEHVWQKLEEEINEFKQAKSQEEKESEFGDILFSLINYARWEGINPDDSLEKTNKKFKYRFEQIELFANKNNIPLKSLTLNEMEQIWNQAK